MEYGSVNWEDPNLKVTFCFHKNSQGKKLRTNFFARNFSLSLIGKKGRKNFISALIKCYPIFLLFIQMNFFHNVSRKFQKFIMETRLEIEGQIENNYSNIFMYMKPLTEDKHNKVQYSFLPIFIPTSSTQFSKLILFIPFDW